MEEQEFTYPNGKVEITSREYRDLITEAVSGKDLAERLKEEFDDLRGFTSALTKTNLKMAEDISEYEDFFKQHSYSADELVEFRKKRAEKKNQEQSKAEQAGKKE